MIKAWKTDVVHWDSIGKDAAAFMFASAEKRLTESVNTSEGINKRADRLLTITVTLLTVSISYLLKDARSEDSDEFLMAAAILVLIPLIYALVYIIRNFMEYSIHVTGASPEAMLTSSRFDRGLSAEHQHLELILDQLESYQDRIAHNIHINKKRMRNNVLAQRALISLPAFLLLVYLVNL
jgi:hypothetical protein